MAKFVNSFALLDDEEEDDVEVLVNRIVKKVDDSLMHAKNEAESSEFARNGSGGRKGGQSHWDGSHENGNGWDDDVEGGNGLGWNRSKDSYVIVDGTIVGDGSSPGQGKDLSGEDGWGIVNEAFGDANVQAATDDAGWLEVSKSRGKDYANHNRPFGDDYGYKNGNRSNDLEKRGYGDQVHNNGAADRQRQYKNGNQSYGGERRGYENQGQDRNAPDGRRQFRNGRRGERRGYVDKAQDSTASSEQQSKVDVNEDNRAGGEERKYRNGNRNFGGEKRGYGGNRERGRQEYRRTGNGEVKENVNAEDGHVNGFGGWNTSDAEMVLEASKTAETEQQNTSEEVTEDTRLPKEDTEEQKKKTESELKQKEEEMKEAALMTLDQYEKLLSEKKQALNSQKTELRKVSIDKELEGMRLIEKKPVASDGIWKSAKDMTKKKNSPKNQALETSKTEDNKEVTESDANQLSEEEKLEKDGSLEKKEKSRKFVTVKVHEIFKPASHRRSFGGRGQGRGGRGEQGGFRDRTNNYGPRTNGDAAARAPAFRRPPIPTDKDFPVLMGNLPALAPGKSST